MHPSHNDYWVSGSRHGSLAGMLALGGSWWLSFAIAGVWLHLAGPVGEDEYKEGHVAQRIPRECESWVIEGVKR